MYKIYFKQAVEMLKQHKFFSIISILGTALAIMMVMVILVTDEVKNISVSPEINRNRTLYITFQKKESKNSWSMGSVTYDIVKKAVSLLTTPQYVSAQTMGDFLVSAEGSAEILSASTMITDPSFWKIMSFNFSEGKGFGEEEFRSGLREAVLSEQMARKLFKGEKAMGQTVLINYLPYRITGIVKDISPVFSQAVADIWITYTSSGSFESSGYNILLLAGNTKDIPAIREEVRQIERQFHEEDPEWELYLRGPETHRVHKMGIWGSSEKEMKENVAIRQRKTWFILAVILLVPAVNLSGLNLSRIRKRTSEIGVRKAFGAKRHVVLMQILCENLITSSIGGIVGLILSYAVLFRMKEWLLGVPPDSMIPLNTIVSFPVLLSVCIVCIVVNILSAAIPAYRASRMKIINSLTNNEKQS